MNTTLIDPAIFPSRIIRLTPNSPGADSCVVHESAPADSSSTRHGLHHRGSPAGSWVLWWPARFGVAGFGALIGVLQPVANPFNEVPDRHFGNSMQKSPIRDPAREPKRWIVACADCQPSSLDA